MANPADFEDGFDSGERGLRAIIEQIPDGILVLDYTGVVLFANSAAERLLSSAPGDLKGREFGYPTLAGETTEIDIPDRGGETRVAEMRVVEADWAGTPALVADLRDVTDRKRIERALRESETRYRQVFDNAQTGNCIVTAQGDLLACNAAFLRIFGFQTVEEARSRKFETLYADPTKRRGLLDRLRKSKTLEACEMRMRRADGSAAHLVVNAFGTFDRRGELESITAYMLDVSDRKNLEEQLRHAQKMEAVGRLAGGLAHDFNNILTIIAGEAAMVLETLPRGEARESLEEVLHAAGRAADITARLLTFSRRRLTKPAEVCVDEFLVGMDRLLRTAAGENVRIDMLASETACWINIDEGELEQVLLNLVVNARDAMPGGGKVTIEAAETELDARGAARLGLAPGWYASVTVTDTGHGMTPEVKDRLFEPFFTTKEPGKGTGLGLSTVYAIVRQGKGAVSVESEPGKGATFRIYLPVARRGAATPQPVAPKPPVAGGPETILLVDDEPALRKVAGLMLRKKGYHVLEAAHPMDALRMAVEGEVDLLVTDVVMPEMSGHELARRLREARPTIPVLYISGYSDDAAFKKELAITGTGFLAKPFTAEALGRRVREALDRGLGA